MNTRHTGQALHDANRGKRSRAPAPRLWSRRSAIRAIPAHHDIGRITLDYKARPLYNSQYYSVEFRGSANVPHLCGTSEIGVPALGNTRPRCNVPPDPHRELVAAH